jgi:AcrR family transcriptional regulator
MASETTPLRRSRERELIQATRALFDERGVLDAPIEEDANAVGTARGLIDRQFSSKEELFVLTVTDYLDELAGLMAAAVKDGGSPRDRAEAAMRSYAEFCARIPFLDSSLSSCTARRLPACRRSLPSRSSRSWRRACATRF